MTTTESQQMLTASVQNHAESLADFMRDTEDEEYREPLDIYWTYSSVGPRLTGITLLITTGGPRIQAHLPEGRVVGSWGSDRAEADAPAYIGEQLFRYLAELAPFPSK